MLMDGWKLYLRRDDVVDYYLHMAMSSRFVMLRLHMGLLMKAPQPLPYLLSAASPISPSPRPLPLSIFS